MINLKIEVVNVVATANTGHPIDLPRLADKPHITYNPSKYFCAYIKDPSMEAKVSVFASGKLIAVGAKSEKSARRDLNHAIKMLQDSGKVNNPDSKFTVENVVVTVDIGREIDFELLQVSFPGMVFEPEQFPGAIIRPQSHDVSVLAFASGKLVIPGLKSSKGMKRIVDEVLREFSLC